MSKCKCSFLTCGKGVGEYKVDTSIKDEYTFRNKATGDILENCPECGEKISKDPNDYPRIIILEKDIDKNT